MKSKTKQFGNVGIENRKKLIEKLIQFSKTLPYSPLRAEYTLQQVAKFVFYTGYYPSLTRDEKKLIREWLNNRCGANMLISDVIG